jgi:hypothetical protein
MPTKLLPTEYLGAGYDGTTTPGQIRITAIQLENGGLTNAEIVEGAAVNPGTTALTAGLTYTILTLGAANTPAALKSAWLDLGWDSSGDSDVPAVGDTFTATGNPAPTAFTSPPSVKSGDVRRVALGICEGMYNKYRDYDLAGTSPDKMTITRSTFFDDANDALTRVYTLTFLTDVTGVEVQEESAD